MMKQSREWYRDTSIYQIYPRSWQDSNGDGIGDIQGIISRLDYIKSLNIETIWVSPFFSSPQKDHGYDISDYRGVAPEYGTMTDCDQLIREVHARDMKIVFDMVMNHTSDVHPWFQESASSRNSPKRDWYVWRDGKAPGKPPTNWLSQVRGNGWQYHKETDQWYWAAFLPFQPDLNYRNPEVKQEMFETLRFWLDKGVDGFRLDIIGAIYEDREFRNNPFSFRLLPGKDSTDKFFQSTKMIENLPETVEFTKELRELVDEYDERFLLGETFGSLSDLRDFTGRDKPDGLHATFLFDSLSVPFTAPALWTLISEYEKEFPEPWYPTWVFANHDSMRRMTWFNGREEMLRLQVLLQHTARGIPVTYQGEEIGMYQGEGSHRKALDPVAISFSWLPGPLFRFFNRITHGQLNRDGCRSPMQWDRSAHAGFSDTEGSTWLPLSRDSVKRNVEVQENEADSLLNFYRALLKLRRREPCLTRGSLELISSGKDRQVLAFERKLNTDLVRVYLNLSRKEFRQENIQGKVLLRTSGTDEASTGNTLIIPPWAGLVLKLNGDNHQ